MVPGGIARGLEDTTLLYSRRVPPTSRYRRSAPPAGTLPHMRESSVEAIFDQRVRSLGGRSYKFVPAHVGNPDRIALLPGGIIRLVELKADDGKLAPAQVLWHRRAAKLGTEVHVVTGAEEARAWKP